MTAPKDVWDHLWDVSKRTLLASEHAVERQFQAARLVASLAVGLFLVGFLLVAQWRGVETHNQRLEGRSDADLAQIVQQLSAENDQLRREALRLEAQIAEAEATEEGQLVLLNQAAREVQSLRVLVGLDAAEGPGVTLRIRDTSDVLLPRDYLDIVNELRAAGAEAISIDGTRFGVHSGFSDSDDGVTLDGEPLTANPVIHAIGNPTALAQALQMPGGLLSTIGTYPGLWVNVVERDLLELPPAGVSRITGGSKG